MGLLDSGGQGFDAFTKNFLQTYTTLNEQARLAEAQKQQQAMQAQQMEMQRMQMAAMQQEQARKGQYQQAIQGLMAPTPGMSQADALAASGAVPEMWNQLDMDTGMSGLTPAGQAAVDRAMAPTPASYTMQDYMQKVAPYLSEAQQVELMKEQLKPREPKSLSEYDILLGAAKGDPIMLRAYELKQEAKKTDQKAPVGYRYTPDGQMEPVPGGPADWKRQEKEQQAFSKVQEVQNSMDDIAIKAQNLKDSPGLAGNFGVRGMVPNMPGSDAANAKAQLDSLKSSIGLTVLANLKAASGAGLGSVTEAEHKLLQGMVADLQKAQSVESVKSALDTIINYTAGAKSRIQTGYDRLYGAKAAPQASNALAVDPIIKQASETHGVPAELIKAVAKIESNFNPNAKNPNSTAAGVMGLIRGTAKDMGVSNVFDMNQNINGGAKYLAIQMQKFGSIPAAVAAYYQGPKDIEVLKRMYPNEWQARLRPDTKEYVDKVMKATQGLQKVAQAAPDESGLIPYKRVR